MLVLTTPTGSIGRKVLANLLECDEPLRVIARDPDRLSPPVRARVEVVQGSHGDAETVNRAFAGAEAVFWLPPPNFRAARVEAQYVDFVRPACAAFRRQGVKQVVSISALGRGVTDKAGQVTASLAMDDLIAATGVGFRALAMPSFMDNVLRQIEPIRNQGVFFGTLDADCKHPTCATRDIAMVATKLLRDRSWSGQAAVPVLGPEDLSCNDMARIMSEVLGKPVRYQQISLDAFRANLLQRGASAAMAQGYVEMMRAKNEGLDDAEPRTPEATTPTTFRQWCEEELKPAVFG